MATFRNPLRADRRARCRFVMRRELQFKVLREDRIVATGVGQTIDISSSGVAFEAEGIKTGSLVELAISWPVLLGETCRMRLIIAGKVTRAAGRIAACTIDRYEFRTQARLGPVSPDTPSGSRLQRWPQAIDKDCKSAVGA